MSQVSQSSPQYSQDWSSVPPILLSHGEVDHRTRDFPLAFGHAREVVQHFVLMTFRLWQDDWELKDHVVQTSEAQMAYNLAPESLKQAIDWQLQWDSPALILTDGVRRSLEHHRRHEAGEGDAISTADRFGRDFDAASPAVQHAAVCTFSAWSRRNEGTAVKPPSRNEVAPAYNAASHPLKAALCYVLELGLTYPVESVQDIYDHKACIQDIVDWQRAKVRRWESGGNDDDDADLR
ncbi:hypothetical protein PENSPDRAFT_751309 [Peniophora sp. CONT]|nr:hypothetical protein PENSPDRAFT_751309 [Peniophora sp. CONT]